MSLVRVVFLGTPDIAAHQLEALISDEHFEVVGVVTQPDRPAGRKMKLMPSAAKTLALEKNLEVITPDNINTPESIEKIKSWGAEAAVVIAYGQILKQEFLDLYPQKIVNLHASLLPRWRGAAPIQRAIMAGDDKTGMSLQIVTKELDAGDVIGTRSFAIHDKMDAMDVYERMKSLGAELLHVEFMDYLRGNLAPVAQNKKDVTYAKKIEKSEAKIQWHMTARQIFNNIRGLKMGPGSYCLRDGKKLKIHKAFPVQYEHKSTPGTILYADKSVFRVACKQNALEVIEVQPESKPKMLVSEYIKGHPVELGELLE